MSKPNIKQIYTVLRQWTAAKRPNTYTQLSHDYQLRTGIYFEPHGSWDAPLGEINRLLSSNAAPAISALVILKETKEPGAAFWGCAPNVPARPRTDIERLTAWSRIVTEVIEFTWPQELKY